MGSVQLKLEKMVSSVVSKPKTSATHPGFTRMITEAITALQSRNGSSRMAILKYITENYKVESAKPVVNVRLSLKRMVDQNLLKMGKNEVKTRRPRKSQVNLRPARGKLKLRNLQ